MNTTAIDLIARSLVAGMTVTLKRTNLFVRGFRALQPLVGEIINHRCAIEALLANARKLYDEARASGNAMFAMGTNRVAAATALSADLREKLKLAKIPLIAILRGGTPAATQALLDLTVQPASQSMEATPLAPKSLEYRVQQPDLLDDVLYVSRALHLRWESNETPFAASHWWRSFETKEAAQTQHCYYRVTPAVFAWYLAEWAYLKNRMRLLDWQLAANITGDEGHRAGRVAAKQRIESHLEKANLPLLDMHAYVAARSPDYNLDAVTPKLPAEPINIVCPFELDPPRVAMTTAWLDGCDQQIDFNLEHIELPTVGIVSIGDLNMSVARNPINAHVFSMPDRRVY
jgi:hypothetical protein